MGKHEDKRESKSRHKYSRSSSLSPSTSKHRSHSLHTKDKMKSLHKKKDDDRKNSTRSHSDSPQQTKKPEKSHKKKKARRSPSVESSDSAKSSNSLKLLKRLEEERSRLREDRRKRKDMMKAAETPEEKRLRRLLKKEAKERKRKERMGWDNEYLHYTNTDNPFGDAYLLETFVWQKKLEKEGLSQVGREELEKRNRAKQEENRRELAKVKQRRQEREAERQRREEEMALLQRQKEAAQFREWGRQEDQFHLEQARLRSTIRIQDGRAKPIDLLAKYISAEEDVDAVEMHEPYTYLNGLTVKDLEDLIEDIKVYKELEKGKNLDYWNDITVIVEDELRKLRKLERNSEYEAAVDRREGIHVSVAQDVAVVFRGKTAAQLQMLQLQIESKINGKAEGIDIGYWESLLSQLKAHIARARLRDRHQENLKHKLEMLKAEQGVKSEDASPAQGDPSRDESESESSDSSQSAGEGTSQVHRQEESEDDKEGETSSEKNIIEESLAEYEASGYSPRYLGNNEMEPGTLVFTEEDDAKRLEFSRHQVLGTGQKIENVMTAEELALQREAKKGMTDDEAAFSVESVIDNQVYLWSDKYRPRKPRYFNRVHTGFEWNKYNQTHYDMDNPPPKIVQGYKFNIFYPDLIDKNSTPEYYLMPCEDNRDFAILRFHAGPPYEDIAFKIVNREWEYSYKRGFRCQFHNNIFQLWFHFKRYRYRR